MIPSRSLSPFFVQLVCELRVGMDLLSELLTALSKLLHEGWNSTLVTWPCGSRAPANVWPAVVSCIGFCLSLPSGSVAFEAVLVVCTMLNVALFTIWSNLSKMEGTMRKTDLDLLLRF